MFVSFQEYLNEMAQSRDHGSTGTIPIDDFDKDFIAQALKSDPRITPVIALRTRYTLLLQDKPKDGDMVRFFGVKRTPWIYAKIDHIHLKELQDKLKESGFPHAANHGFTPSNEELNATDHKHEFYQDAFGNQNAKDSLEQGFISVNTRIKTATKVSSSAMARIMNQVAKEQGRELTDEEKKQQGDSTLPKIPPLWGLKFNWDKLDKPESNDTMNTINKIHGTNFDDYSDVWDAVKTLVPEHISPYAWELFKNRLPAIGNIIASAVKNKLKKWHEGALESAYEIKQYMAQVTAEALNRNIKDISYNNPEKLWIDSPALINSTVSNYTLNVIRRWQDNIQGKGSFNKFQAGNKAANYNKFAANILDPKNNDYESEEEYKELETTSNAMKSILAKVDAAGGDPEVAKLTDDEYDKWREYTNMKNKYDKMAQDREKREQERRISKGLPPVVSKKKNNKDEEEKPLIPMSAYRARLPTGRHAKPSNNYNDSNTHLFTTFDQFLIEKMS